MFFSPRYTWWYNLLHTLSCCCQAHSHVRCCTPYKVCHCDSSRIFRRTRSLKAQLVEADNSCLVPVVNRRIVYRTLRRRVFKRWKERPDFYILKTRCVLLFMLDLPICERFINVRLIAKYSNNISTRRFVNALRCMAYIGIYVRIYICHHERTIAASWRLRGFTPGHEFKKLLVYALSTYATLPRPVDYFTQNYERAHSQCIVTSRLDYSNDMVLFTEYPRWLRSSPASNPSNAGANRTSKITCSRDPSWHR